MKELNKKTKNPEEKQIDFKKIEAKWQKEWEKKKAFSVKENVNKKKYYVLEMFPYPSGSGLHMGHAFNYSIGDIYSRFKRMNGFNVLYPMGYDSLGLPAENAAIKAGTHPKKYTETAIKNFIKQQKELGLSYDWNRMIETHNPDYYKWDQWIFLKMLEKGLAYRKKSAVNFCEKCNTVLANEQVHQGKCWRHTDTDVQIKHLEQWFIKITDYCDELLDEVDNLKWPEKIKAMQKNWIGKSYGTEIDFEIETKTGKSINKISNVIFVHGCPTNIEKSMDFEKRTYDKHWMPWIKKELENKGINALTPKMPEPWKPDYNSWKKEFEKVNINENSVLIGHSCGCAFLVRWLGETKKKINKLILVAPWKIPEGDSFRRKFYEYDVDNTIKSRIKKVIIFTSDNEESDGKKSAKIFHDELEGRLIELKGKGHFTFGDMGTNEFPELLNEIISESGKTKWPIFTTRPDTIYGVTFMVVSAQHPKLMELVTPEQKKEVDKFLNKIKSTSEKEMSNNDEHELEKEGAFTGSYAINPLTNDKVPVYTGNFVVADYGSGMVMAVPAHDQRDYEFAKKYSIPIKVVIQPRDFELDVKRLTEAYTKEGIIINSQQFNNLNSKEAIEKITEYLEKKKLGRKKVQFKLRDWLVSRQRYWGTPIPVVYCSNCGVVPVPEKDLPVKLPEKVTFGKGNPLETNTSFVQTKCPKCKGKARRETDTMDTFVNSSWYYLRYCDNKNKKEIFDKKKAAYWCPIDQYIGGAEHACMHLIYFRFYTKFLRDIGMLNFSEPATKLFNQGMLHGEDGFVMSKSRGNVVLPEEVSKKYGIDTARLFLVSIASPDKDLVWSDKRIEGSSRFVKRLFDYFENIKDKKYKLGKSSKKLESKLNKTIKEYSEDIENFRYNLAVIKIRELFEMIFEEKEVSKKDIESALKLLHPICPHITEEFYSMLKNKKLLTLESWPIADESKIDEALLKQDEQIDKISQDINNIVKIIESKGKKARKVFVYVLPNEKQLYRENIETINKKTNLPIAVYAVNDKDKHDPENKSKNAKPGKPGIYIE